MTALHAQLEALAAQVAGRPTQGELLVAMEAASAAGTANALAASSNLSNAVAELGTSPGDSPATYDVQVVYDKVNELITALRRV